MTRRYLLSGRVQGVGFRYYVQEWAIELGILGRVRNLPDGTVEVVAQAAPEALSEFEACLRRGPRFSEVRELRSWAASEEAFQGFSIER